jgi:integrase
MALRLYRRHVKACSQTSYTNQHRCQCPIWVRGTLNNQDIRRSMDQTDWTAASALVTAWTKAGAIGQINDPAHNRTLVEAIDLFLLDCTARKLAPDTLKKYRNLLGYVDPHTHTVKGRLRAYCDDRHIAFLNDVTLEVLTRFRATWRDSSITMAKTQERLRWFFQWCLLRKYVTENPADGLTAVKVDAPPTLPFTEDEYAAILAACPRYRPSPNYRLASRDRITTFVLLLRWTGLRIRDVSTLEWDRIKNGKVFLRTQKTGQRVYVPVPPEVTDALSRLERRNRFIFWSGTGAPESITSNWQRALRSLFRIAGIEGGHAHRFRDTFAVELLLRGVDMADVAVLLGHRSTKTTEKHYAPWVRARQSRLESVVSRTWSDVGPTATTSGDKPALPPTPESATLRRVSGHRARA